MNRPLLTLILAALATTGCQPKGPYEDTSLCLNVPDDATSCPAASDVDKDALFAFGWCDVDVDSITGEGALESSPFNDSGSTDDVVCCYPAVARNAQPDCAVGRPFLQGGCPTEAPVRPGSGWSDVALEPIQAGSIDWLAMARMEHASIASFARLTLDLLALGAPATLLAQVQQAALDEVEHARTCFALHTAATGEAVEPGPLPVEPHAPASAPAIAAAAVREGCLGETMGAHLLLQVVDQLADPELASVLQRIADDEARHAALSWQIVGWLVQTGDPAVLQAVEAAFAEPFAVSMPRGMASDAQLERWVQQATQQVIEPARRVVLA